MTKFAAGIFGLFLILEFVQSNEAKSRVAASRIEKAASPKKNVRADDQESFAVSETRRIVEEIIKNSYPDLQNAEIKIKTFHSRSDFFRSRFSFARFLTFRKLHFLILVNPQIFARDAPASGVRAIIAHELAHVAYYRRHNRFELIGLAGLLSDSFTVRFERGADLQTIERGYGAGLKEYRQWLYQNIPQKNLRAKKRDYFSPEEIDLITNATEEKPALFNFWRKNIPRNAAEIKADSVEKRYQIPTQDTNQSQSFGFGN